MLKLFGAFRHDLGHKPKQVTWPAEPFGQSPKHNSRKQRPIQWEVRPCEESLLCCSTVEVWHLRKTFLELVKSVLDVSRFGCIFKERLVEQIISWIQTSSIVYACDKANLQFRTS